MNIAVFVSGGGTNLQAILDWIHRDKPEHVNIVRIIASREGTFAQQRGEKAGIPVSVIIRSTFSSQSDYDTALAERMHADSVELIVLAGFLSFLGPDFIHRYKNRIINIHPALIPSFCGKGMYGLQPHIAVLEAGVKVTGATVHFVDEEYDKGPILLQKAVTVDDNDTAESLQMRVMKEAEQVILPLAIQLLAENKVRIIGNRTIIVKNP
jgi:phosphoribosylglycinamide formyltransferase-1